MCGIVGYWDKRGADKSVVGRMAMRIRHRGPDDAGVWLNEEGNLSLAHRRLSIIDLSPAGHQPMISPCGRFTLVYNGEIYNHQDLRIELEGEGGHFNWRGHSDTETLLATLRHWGIEGALNRLNGMFAFALWDAAERLLYLSRDRVGEKPLYYGNNAETFLFGSELKALTAHPSWSGEIDRDALTLYLRHSYVPSPWSIYKGIKKLPPAHYVVIGDNGKNVSEPHCYWSLDKIAESQCVAQTHDKLELIDELDRLLRDAVKKRMAADVPLGAFLSGGYDSTLITALMQAQSSRSVKTFTIGFKETGYDEAEYAKAVAGHLGTEHTELYVSPQDAMAVIPELGGIWDEPFADSSQIPTYLVSKLAQRDVTVALSGDGGDELFFGYSRYCMARRFEKVARFMPLGLRKIASSILGIMSVIALDWTEECLPRRLRNRYFGDRLRKLGNAIRVSDAEKFYIRLMSHWKSPSDLVLGGEEPGTLLTERSRWPKLPGLDEYMMYLDSMTYLPDDILTKVDRASMATSLETRVPLLDHRVVEFSWQVPTEFKLRNGQAKWLLRQVLYRYVPKKLMERPKMGFGVPIEHWLRGPLREWAEELLDEKRLREEGIIEPGPVRQKWEEHLSGKHRWHYYLWDILMFQSWLEENKK